MTSGMTRRRSSPRSPCSHAPVGRTTCPRTPDWPPRLLVLGATPDDRAALARVAARHEAGDLVVYAPALAPDDAAAVVAGSRGVALPMIAESSGLAALDALAVGCP
jgi:hypothetical protein